MLPTPGEQRDDKKVLWMTLLLKNWVKFDDHVAVAAGTILFGTKDRKFEVNLRNNGASMNHENGKLVIRYGSESLDKPRITYNALVDFVETDAFYSFPCYYTKLTATLELEGLNEFSFGAPDTNNERVRFTNIWSIKQTIFTEDVIMGTQRLVCDDDGETAQGLPCRKIKISFIRSHALILSLVKFYLPYSTFYVVAIIAIFNVDYATFVQIIVGLLVALVMSGKTMIDVENNYSLCVLNMASLLFVLMIIPLPNGYSLVFPALVYVWQVFSAWKAFRWLQSQKMFDETKYISLDEDKVDKKMASASTKACDVIELFKFKDL